MARTPRNKRKARVPVNPLKAQVNAYAKAAIQPYQTLLGQGKDIQAEEASRLTGIEGGTQRELGNISNQLTSGYGGLQRAHADAQRKAVEDLAGQSDFLSRTLGGNFASGAFGLADAQNTAQGVQAAASDRLLGESALGDVARSRAASRLGTQNVLQRSVGDWASRGQGVRGSIAGIHASRPFIRRQFETQNLQNRLDLAAAKLAGWTARTNADIAREGNAIDAITAAGKGAGDAKKAADKKRAGYNKVAKEVYNRLWTVGPVNDKDGNPTDKNTTYGPQRPLRTSFSELVDKDVPPDVAARYVLKWINPRENPNTWGAGKNQLVKAREIAALFRSRGVSEPQIAKILVKAYGRKAIGWSAPGPQVSELS